MADYSIEEMKCIVVPIATRYSVEYVYPFGSRAGGDNAPESDVDL